jgi:hypothetical protein
MIVYADAYNRGTDVVFRTEYDTLENVIERFLIEDRRHQVG